MGSPSTRLYSMVAAVERFRVVTRPEGPTEWVAMMRLPSTKTLSAEETRFPAEDSPDHERL